MEAKNTNVEEVKETDNVTSQPQKKKKKVFAWLFCITIVILFIAYGAITFYYKSHFFPNTVINGFDCSNREVAEVTNWIDAGIRDYKIEVVGRLDGNGEIGIVGELKADDIQLEAINTYSGLENILEQQNPWLWVETLTGQSYNHFLVQSVSCDVELMKNLVSSWEVFQQMEEPKDAYISEYSEEDNKYTVLAEEKGNKVDVQQVIELLEVAVVAREAELNLEEAGCYVQPQITSDDKELNEKVDTINTWLSTSITYDWNGEEVVVDGELIHGWASFENGEPTLNEEAVAEFVADMASERDTYGKKRNFMTSLGVEKTLPSGAYGWKTDKDAETEELLQLIYQGSTTEREPIYSSKGRQKGMSDIGSSYVEADLTNQHLYLYYKGNLVLETAFVSGIMTDPGCVTPYGVFGLTYKTSPAVLRGADYEQPVTYWMPFHGNFGMHDATWRTEFGGDIYLTNGSHGCLNLPLDSARVIYEYVSTGFPIICYY